MGGFRIIHVNDDQGLLSALESFLKGQYPSWVEVTSSTHLYDAMTRVETQGGYDLYIVDLNLLDKHLDALASDLEHEDGVDTATSKYGVMTSLDGLRLYGWLYARSQDVRVVMYTARKGLLKALAEYVLPGAPFRLVDTSADIGPLQDAIRDGLFKAAREMVLSLERSKAEAALRSDLSGEVNIGSRPLPWRTLLMPVALWQGHNDPASALRSLLPFCDRMLILCRLFKPTDYCWGKETYGIPDPTIWHEGGACCIKRTALERVLHTPGYSGEPALLSEQAHEQLRYAESLLSPTTAPKLRKGVVGSLTQQAPTNEVLEVKQEALEISITDILSYAAVQEPEWDGLWPGQVHRKRLLECTFYAEKEMLSVGIRSIRESAEENAGVTPSVRARVHSKPNNPWFHLDVFIRDSGAGFTKKRSDGSLSHYPIVAAFPESPVPQASALSFHGHRLTIAESALFGYCDWHIATRRKLDEVVSEEGWDVYGRTALEGTALQELLARLDGGSGTVHHLRFRLPKPVPSYIPPGDKEGQPCECS